jgi:purine-binding chemotaxis protein CheW
VLPVIDLRMKFRLPPIEYNKFTVIVIAMVADKMVGLLVDAVSDVLQVTQEAMRSAPILGRRSIRVSSTASFRPASILQWRST